MFMKKVAILAASIMVIALMMAFATTAFAAVPHGGYGTGNAPAAAQTDLCLSCHDIHQAAGDYALMREATVTETCQTCHGLFGDPAPATATWTETPFDLDADGDSAEASVSPTTAYENTGAARVSGHRLGASDDVYNLNAGSDYIPGSTLSLKVMDSLAYEEGDIYEGESVTAYAATNGLYCASCHTPHGSVGGTDTDADGEIDSPIPVNNYNTAGVVTSQAYFGDQLVIDDDSSHPKNVKAEKLISSNPNHLNERSLKTELADNGDAIRDPGELIPNGMIDKFMTVDEPATTYNNWCLSCHDKQWNGSEWEGTEMHGNPVGGNNHPPLCVSCHSASGGNKGVKDFPHTSGNQKLLSKDHDGICLGCHSSNRLP
jgi:predicted CXXCH cytochrome family protein